MRKIILASNSPRRKSLMKLLGIPFEVVESNFDESVFLEKDPKKLVKILSYEKARVVASIHKDAIIIGADTVLVYKGEIFGKPRNKKDAVRILKALSGTKHQAITGFTILDSKTNKKVTASTASTILFKELTEEEIKAYIETGEPMDKAGAYAIQERGGLFVREIHGDVFNIVGLPLKDIRHHLAAFGIKILN